ncbi:MAG TPA: response regulator [Anaerolineae bacterium]|nr:response regulator [Anaerolineae bacterium]
MNPRFALIVEDEPDLATIYSEALKAGGFETEIVYDGAVALQRLKEVNPMVVVLDLNLPHIAGTDILAQIRADERLAKTQVVIATADAAMAEMLGESADLVLLKPVSFMQLRMMAERLAFSVEGN